MKRLCSVDGCQRIHFGLGFCSAHYRRLKRHGSATGGRVENHASLAWLKLQLSVETDACIEWPFPSKRRGYGALTMDGSQIDAHRAMCLLKHGRPEGRKEAAHSCGNSLCVNHRHIRWATPKENQHDKVGHGTDNGGARNPMSKLTEYDVANIRSLAGSMSNKDIAERFGVSGPAISLIISGKRWN